MTELLVGWLVGAHLLWPCAYRLWDAFTDRRNARAWKRAPFGASEHSALKNLYFPEGL